MMRFGDVRHAFRRLLRQPAITLASVGMLALAIGLTTGVFTVADALLLRPVPFHDPLALSGLYMGNEHGGRTNVAPPVLAAWRRSPAFTAAASAQADTALIDLDGAVITRPMAWVTPDLFTLLGNVQPLRGRLFDAVEGRAGTDDRLLVSESVWRGVFASDPAVVGRRVTIDGESLLIIGVLPSEFHFPASDTAIWRPIDFDAAPVARAAMRPSVYVRFAANLPRQEALRLATDAARAADPSNKALVARMRPVVFENRYDRRAIPILIGGVAFVFLVLCINVCSLLLAQLTERRREFSIAAALGASPGQLMRQALAESLLVGALGIVIGIGVGWGLVAFARAFLSGAYVMHTLNPMIVDLRALAVAAVAGVTATLGAGLLPAALAGRTDAIQSMRTADRTGTDTRTGRMLTRGLLIAEVALACMLLAVATLLVRSFVKLMATDRGIEVAGITGVMLSLPADTFPDGRAREAAARLIESRVLQLPGIQKVVWSRGLPPGTTAFSFGQWQPDPGDGRSVDMMVDHYDVGGDFFALYGIPLLTGRTFDATDGDHDVILSEDLAKRLWPASNPIGRTFRFDNEQFHTIGVAREIRFPSLDPTIDRPELYRRFTGVGRTAMMSVRCAENCPSVGLLRQTLMTALPGVKVESIQRAEDAYGDQLIRPRAAASVALLFAAIALTAAGGGLFCVLSFGVGRRRREFGIRMALGSSPRQLWRLVVRDSLMVCTAGITLGALGAFWLATTIAALQYGVTVADPATWSLVIGLVTALALAASWRPARDAMAVDPVRLLRDE